jgi:hypothetical protein
MGNIMSTDLEKYRMALAEQKDNNLKKRLHIMSYEELDAEMKQMQIVYDEHIYPDWKVYEDMSNAENSEEMFEAMDEYEAAVFLQQSNIVAYHALLMIVYERYRDRQAKKRSLTIIK